MALIKIAANAVRARLVDAPRDVRLRVSELLSYLVEGHEHTDRFKSGSWDGRASYLEFSTGTFPAGFVPAVHSDLVGQGHAVQLYRKPLPPALGPSVEEAYAAVNPFPVDPKYDFQPEAVRRLERHGMIIAQVATGGGKSMIARAAVKRLGRPTIFLTTRGVLMHQMRAGFEAAGFKVGVLGDSEWRPVRGVNVAMIQTLVARLADGSEHAAATRKLLEIFEFAILEEAHEVGGAGYFHVMNALVNANYRMALTATPFMRPDAEANMRLMAVSGQIGMRVPEKLLIDRGILARPVFKFVQFPKDERVTRWQNWQKAYQLGVVEHRARNAAIVFEARRAVAHGLSTLILVQREKHGLDLKEMLRAAGVRVDFISGKHGQDQRQRALDRLRDGKLDALIGSTILDVGVDAPAIGVVILAGGGKAEVALRQRIGRGLRAKKAGPNVCFVVDFYDDENRYLREHRQTRMAIIEGTPGFAENMLPAGADLPYHLFAAAA